ncbi:hypothetical protein EMIHUDRAFT_242945 [Emiliania huxleyi CCMP1516]|uniref:Uncharacterized protein n=2 Tax=Emiliania huxleyi TaxID=2903 RepID=A0A0D3J745_EMIH1|nr:hypothetical protein EMIHUDRAFT_242945 [Emiliania huxleyi CCMP1516]EOD19330.1 hypothetical protein EMIHUDRAFT_242945 [Emiliania huxleyi CCMP1516]|eukprot:XP_005771759.1 hypothetical protein EMIHUDRAFT_242945 [Emiliania huxleyi CCMP1516]
MSFSLAACAASCAALLHRPQPSCTAIGRSPTPRMQGAAGAPRDRGAERKTAAEDERDLTWFYASDDSQKVFSDYEWDPDFPGTFKPGLKRENYDFDEVVEMWKDRPNENTLHLPLKPPERILDWLARKGLLSEPEQEGEEGARAESGLLDEEFDLDEADEEGGGMGDAPLIDQKELGGATMSDFL